MVAGYGIPLLAESTGIFPDDMAVCQLMPDNKQSLDSALQRHEGTAQILFLTTWGNSGWTAEETGSQAVLESELLPVNDLCLFTGAILLSLMECFDSAEILMVTGCRNACKYASQPTGFGIIAIILHFHSTRLTLYPELIAHLSPAQ